MLGNHPLLLRLMDLITLIYHTDIYFSGKTRTRCDGMHRGAGPGQVYLKLVGGEQ